MVARAFAGRSATVAVLRAQMGAIAAADAIEAHRIADQLAVFDAGVALVDRLAGLPGVGGPGVVVAIAAAGGERPHAQRRRQNC